MTVVLREKMKLAKLTSGRGPSSLSGASAVSGGIFASSASALVSTTVASASLRAEPDSSNRRRSLMTNPFSFFSSSTGPPLFILHRSHAFQTSDPLLNRRMGAEEVHQRSPRQRVDDEHVGRRGVRLHRDCLGCPGEFFEGVCQAVRLSRDLCSTCVGKEFPGAGD